MPVIEKNFIAFTESSLESMFTVGIDGKANTMEDSVMRINDKTSIEEDLSFQSLEVLANQSECLVSKPSTFYPRFSITIRVQ